MGPVSESNTLPCESSALHLVLLSPIDSASPESSLSILEGPTPYNPNLSEEEPLFSASTFNWDSVCVMRFPAKISRSQGPAPGADLWHVVAVLADVKLVTFHCGPEARRRLLHLIAEPWSSLDGVQHELIAVEIVQHDHVEGRRGGTFLPVPPHMNIVVIAPPVGKLVDHRGIAMEGKDHRLICRQQLIEILIFQTMGMF